MCSGNLIKQLLLLLKYRNQTTANVIKRANAMLYFMGFSRFEHNNLGPCKGTWQTNFIYKIGIPYYVNGSAQ